MSRRVKLHKLCELEDVTPERGKEVMLRTPEGNSYIAIFRVGEGVRAYLNTCPHQGRSLNWAPDEFLIGSDGRLVCPHHGASFDLASGACLGGPCVGDSLTPVPVLIKDGGVWK